MLFHKDIVCKFPEEYYANNITLDSLPNDKKVITEKEGSIIIGQISGWEVKSNDFKQTLLIPDMINDIPAFELFPFKVSHTYEKAHQGRMYRIVDKISTFRIQEENMVEFRKIVDLFSDIKHSTPQDFKLFCMLSIGSLFIRINWRVMTGAGFGKTSGVGNILSSLFTDVECMKVKSAPKLALKCHKRRAMFFDEYMEIPFVFKKEMETHFRTFGDYENVLKNPSLSSGQHKTLDKYDISKLSMCIIYNNLSYYEGKEHEYFDNLYTPATLERYFPLAFHEGVVDTTQWGYITDSKKQYESYKKLYLGIVKSIYWLEKNYVSLLDKKKFVWHNKTIFGSSKECRLNSTFQRMSMIVKLYSETEQEYNMWLDKITKHYNLYQSIINN